MNNNMSMNYNFLGNDISIFSYIKNNIEKDLNKLSNQELNNFNDFIFLYIKYIIEKDFDQLSHQELFNFNYIIINFKFNNIIYYLDLKEILDLKFYNEFINVNSDYSKKKFEELNSKYYSGLPTFAKKYAFYIAKVDIRECNNEEETFKNIYNKFSVNFKNNYFFQIIFGWYTLNSNNNNNNDKYEQLYNLIQNDLNWYNLIADRLEWINKMFSLGYRHPTSNELDEQFYNLIENNLEKINKLLSLDVGNEDDENENLKQIFNHFYNILSISYYKFSNILYYYQIRFYLKTSFEYKDGDTNNCLIKSNITENIFLEKFFQFINEFKNNILNNCNISFDITSKCLNNNYLMQILSEKKN